MKSRFAFAVSWFSLALILGLTACGPTPDEQTATSVALTASAASDTPAPTLTITPSPTSTPVPYDLTVVVHGVEGTPVQDAVMSLVGMEGESGSQITDENGEVAWFDLPGEDISLHVHAQGYLPAEVTEVIHRGENEIIASLERDPYGLLPAEACGPAETLLYIEDLQDGTADGWPAIRGRAFGWDVSPDPENPENMLVHKSGGDEAFADLEDLMVENMVWRTKFWTDGTPWISFQWRVAPDPYDTEDGTVEDSRYVVNFEETSYINREQQPVRSLFAAGNPYVPRREEWHFVEVSSFGGEQEVWIDGFKILSYNDPNPLPAGRLIMEIKPQNGEDNYYLDNIAVCELHDSFAPLPTPTPGA